MEIKEICQFDFCIIIPHNSIHTNRGVLAGKLMTATTLVRSAVVKTLVLIKWIFEGQLLVCVCLFVFRVISWQNETQS